MSNRQDHKNQPRNNHMNNHRNNHKRNQKNQRPNQLQNPNAAADRQGQIINLKLRSLRLKNLNRSLPNPNAAGPKRRPQLQWLNNPQAKSIWQQ